VFSTHYRNPLDFSENAMQDAMAGLDRLYECVAAIDELRSTGNQSSTSSISAKDTQKLESLQTRFEKAMDNDFNTAQALGILKSLSIA